MYITLIHWNFIKDVKPYKTAEDCETNFTKCAFLVENS